MQLDPKPATVAERLPASAAARSDAEKHSIRLRSLRSLRHISQFHVISAPIIEKTALGPRVQGTLSVPNCEECGVWNKVALLKTITYCTVIKIGSVSICFLGTIYGSDLPSLYFSI